MALMNRTFNAVMAYEDAITAERAKEAWDSLVCTSFQGRHDPGLRLWKFDGLRAPEMRDVASKHAAQADMILIATRGAGQLPTEVKAWIDGWLARKRKASANQSTLAALFDALSNTVGIPALAQFAYLQRVARRGNMDFLVSTFDPSGETVVFSRCKLPHETEPPEPYGYAKVRHRLRI
jgi:hypothetical protein